MKDLIHYGCHFGVPIAIALVFYPQQWRKALAILWATMLIDLDHLLADPIFDPNRCSVGFHPLHQNYMLAVYLVLALGLKGVWRNVGIGLLWHIATDSIDCAMM